MRADGTGFRRGRTDMNMSAVGALPNGFGLALEHLARFNVGQQLTVTLLVLLFDSGDAVEKLRNIIEALLARFLGELSVHIGPLVIFSLGSRQKIFLRRADTVVQKLEPDFSVLLFVVCGFLENRSYLNKAVLFSL